jgi:hypothetical protein
MSETREKHADMLETASKSIEVVNLTSPMPHRVLNPAIKQVEQVWQDCAHYATSGQRNSMRIAILRARAFSKAAEHGRMLTNGDYVALADSAVELRNIASLVRNPENATHGDRSRYSVTGRRNQPDRYAGGSHTYVSLSSGRVIEELHDPFENATQYRAKMPKSIPVGQNFVLFRCPLIIYMKKFVPDSMLDRSGIKWERLGSEGRGPSIQNDAVRIKEASVPSIMMHDQILIGMDKGKAGALGKDAVSKIVTLVQTKLGRMVAPLGENSRFLVSPGNQLDWLWIVPERAWTTSQIVVRDVSFPWKTEKVQMTDAVKSSLERELKSLDDSMRILVQENQILGQRDLTRRSEILELLDRQEKAPMEKMVDIQSIKADMLATIKKRLAPLLAQEADYRQQLVDIGRDPATIRSRLKQGADWIKDHATLLKNKDRKSAIARKDLEAKIAKLTKIVKDPVTTKLARDLMVKIKACRDEQIRIQEVEQKKARDLANRLKRG